MEKKKVVLIFPPTEYQIKGTVEGRGARRSAALSPSLGLLYIARILIDAGYPVVFYDFSARGYDRNKLRELISGAGVVGVTLQSFNRESVAHVLQDIKELAPKLPVMVGGPDCVLHPRMIENSDVTSFTEAETTIETIVDAVTNGGVLSQCKGIFYREDGAVRQTKAPELLRNLDTIKFPARELIDWEGFDFVGKRFTKRLATMITSRGCPFGCTFCARITSRLYRERSVDNVLDEIEHVYESGYKYLAFVDDEFIFKKARVKKIMRGIIDRKIKLRMLVQGRVDSVDDELFALMREAGVRMIIFGLESGNQETLDFFNKRTTVGQNRLAVELADKYDIFSFGFFIIGAPMETERHIQDTIDFAMSVPLDGMTFNVLDYTAGSKIWKDAVNRGLIRPEEFNVPADKARGLGNFSKAELNEICFKTFSDFYRRGSLWGRYLRKIVKLHEPWALQLLYGFTNRYLKDLRD